LNNNFDRQKNRKFTNRYSSNHRRGARTNRGGSSNNIKIPISKFINKASFEIPEIKTHEELDSFTNLLVDHRLKKNLQEKGFDKLTPIQAQAIPHILEGKDLIGIASTGTGKTLAFLVPMLNKVIKNPSEKILIITPTREIATQIEQELFKITYQLGIRRVVCIGGTSITKQIYNLKKSQNHFVIGTPGRLKDLIDRKILCLSDFTNVVIDEVDRMFDMGFAPSIKYILDLITKKHQSLFFSATIDPKIISLINQYSRNPVTVKIQTRDTAETVDQDVVRFTNSSTKLDVLDRLLKTPDFHKTLIFGRTKHQVHKLAQALSLKGFKTGSIHGNKTQSQREKSLQLFKNGGIDILVATDVAARGLDIPDVTHVINYEIPATYSDYIHRIGRTGRANKAGKALTFVEG
jgi:ATP-dependent RNA helicase RhlE